MDWTGNQMETTTNNEMYYFSKREIESILYKKENEYREAAGYGWWKATGHVKKFYEGERPVGSKRPFTFHKFEVINQKNRDNAKKTNWIMHEYALLAYDVKEWRLCKIYYKGKLPSQEELKNARQNSVSKSSDFEAGNNSPAQNHQQPPLELVNSSAIPNPDDRFGPLFSPGMPLEMTYDHHLHCHHELSMSFVSDMEPDAEEFPSLWSWQK